MEGLRKQESNKFEKFFSIVQETAKSINSLFFLDAGDGRPFETNLFEGEDLMGWLIPDNKLLDFKKEWETGDVSDEWSDFYVWAIWENPNSPVIKFE